MTGRMAGQTINDRLLAARHSLAGQGLAKSVCKATTEEMIGPKKKHLDYLVHCTNEPNVSIPQLANLLIERSQNTNWVVVYKALITVHHVMCYGNERFTQYLASSNSTFQLSNFLDKSGVQGLHNVKTGYDMSPFIRRYARYLNEKALSYRTVAFDFCKVKRGKEDGLLRTMNAEKLLKTLPTLQNQLDALLDFDCSANDLTNGVINMSFMLLFRDLIRLFACYNDGIINLLEKYFDMNKKQCRDALDIYKKFLTRMDRVGEFLKVAENVGIDKGDIPDLTKAPSSLLDALEQHLASMEGKKSSSSSTPSQASSNQKNVRSAVTALSSTSNAFGTVVANGRLDSHSNGIDENLKLKALAEEEAAMNQFKSKVSPTAANNPFLSSSSPSTISSQSAVDLFTSEPIAPAPPKPSDDLLQLGNPFVFSQPPVNNPPIFSQPNNMWMANGNGYAVPQPVSPVISNGAFVPESAFSSVFGNTESSAAEDTVVQPTYNPFLVDDPTPSMLIDPDSPSSTKPIQNVLSYFQKESNFSEINSQNLSDKSNEIVDKKNEEYNNISAKTICDKNNLQCSNNDNNVLNGSNVKKCAPPPRPPPPHKNPTEPPVNTDCSSAPEIPADNNYPSVFTANEGLPLVTQNIDGNSHISGGVLQPTSLQGNQNSLTPTTTNNNNNNQQSTTSSSALLTGDLESSLASLAENLSINSRPAPVKGVQWNSPKNNSKMGNSWTPQPISATTGAGYKPMNQSMISPQPTTIQPQLYPQLQPVMGMRPMAANPTILPQFATMAAAAPATNPLGQQQSLLFH